MKEQEIWKPVPGFEGYYEVSNLGRIRSMTRSVPSKWSKNGIMHISGKIMRPAHPRNGGYFSILLRKNNSNHNRYIHRLVAEAFLDNPQHLPMVNHKDENKRNNRVDNLEWCDVLYNNRYGTGEARRYDSAKRGKCGRCYPKDIAQYSKSGEFLAIYPSSQAAARAIGRPERGGNIRACARGEMKTSCGFVWKYQD